MNVISFLGQGTVAADKKSNTHDIFVYLPSVNPLAKGRVLAQTERLQQEGLDSQGKVVKSDNLRSNAVPAIWKNFGEPNRVTSPDVKEGTPVLLYQITGSDTIYWTTFGQNINTHRLETIMWGFSANPIRERDNTFDLENFYTVMLSTHTGELRYRTTRKNGEATAFDICVDSMNGKIVTNGELGSGIILNDVEQSLTYFNNPGSIFNITKKNIAMVAPDKVTLEAVEKFNIFTKNLDITVGDTFNLHVGNTTNVTIKTKLNVDCPNTDWKGNINQTGNYVQSGNYDHTGNYTQKGVYNATGNEARTGNTAVTGLVSAGGGIASTAAARSLVQAFAAGQTIKETRSSAGGITADGTLHIKGSATIVGALSAAGGEWTTANYFGHKHDVSKEGAPTGTPDK